MKTLLGLAVVVLMLGCGSAENDQQVCWLEPVIEETYTDNTAMSSYRLVEFCGPVAPALSCTTDQECHDLDHALGIEDHGQNYWAHE